MAQSSTVGDQMIDLWNSFREFFRTDVLDPLNLEEDSSLTSFCKQKGALTLISMICNSSGQYIIKSDLNFVLMLNRFIKDEPNKLVRSIKIINDFLEGNNNVRKEFFKRLYIINYCYLFMIFRSVGINLKKGLGVDDEKLAREHVNTFIVTVANGNEKTEMNYHGLIGTENYNEMLHKQIAIFQKVLKAREASVGSEARETSETSVTSEASVGSEARETSETSVTSEASVGNGISEAGEASVGSETSEARETSETSVTSVTNETNETSDST